MATMIEKWKCLWGYKSNKPIFIIGTGRSGTNWLGKTLSIHPEISATIERQPIFGLSTRIAMNPQFESHLYKRLVWMYRLMLLRAAPHHYLDKSHPNIWIAERLHATFPRAQFIGIERNPYATVASMMNHKAVSMRHERWRQFPVPNRFLGITEQNAKIYQRMPMAAKCALRWLAHHQRMDALRHKLGEALTVIPFENFVYDTQNVIENLGRFLDLKNPIAAPAVDYATLNKWEAQLADNEIKQIHDIVGISPEHYASEKYGLVKENPALLQ